MRGEYFWTSGSKLAASPRKTAAINSASLASMRREYVGLATAEKGKTPRIPAVGCSDCVIQVEKTPRRIAW
jgi:hypothetical protein